MAEPLKKQRSQALHALAEQHKQAFLQQQVGQTVPVLWEYARPLNETQQLFLLSETFGKPFTAFVLFNHDTRQSRLLSFSNPHGQMKVLSC